MGLLTVSVQGLENEVWLIANSVYWHVHTMMLTAKELNIGSCVEATALCFIVGVCPYNDYL